MQISNLANTDRLSAKTIAISSLKSPQNLYLLLFAGFFAIVSSGAQELVGEAPAFSFTRYFALMGLLVPTFLLVVAVVWFFHMAIWVRPEKPLDYARSSLKFLLSKEMLISRALPVFAYLFILMSSYSGLKHAIGDFNSYSWDSTLADLDNALFLGNDPWVIVHGAFPGMVWAKAFNFFYHLWFFVMFGLWFWAAGMPARSRSRIAFLFAYGFCWVFGGILMAVTFASVGPCYYQRLLGDPRFSGLMHTLRSYDLMAVALQDELWDVFATHSNGVGAGISAFPSMHCASATLFVLFGFSRSRKLGCVLLIFAMFVYVGSVYLGWHYAVDGIAGIGIGICSWLCGLHIAARITERASPELPGSELMAALGSESCRTQAA